MSTHFGALWEVFGTLLDALMAFDTLFARRLTLEPSTHNPVSCPAPTREVTDKTPGKAGVPEQGFEGQAVSHKDMETITEVLSLQNPAFLKARCSA